MLLVYTIAVHNEVFTPEKVLHHSDNHVQSRYSRVLPSFNITKPLNFIVRGCRSFVPGVCTVLYCCLLLPITKYSGVCVYDVLLPQVQPCSCAVLCMLYKTGAVLRTRRSHSSGAAARCLFFCRFGGCRQLVLRAAANRGRSSR